MKNLRSWAILAATVGAIGLTAYVAAESNNNATSSSIATQVERGCVPYPETNRGTVMIRYVDTEGNEIESYVSLTQDIGSQYSTTDYKPTTINYNGKTYTLKGDLTTGSESGTITEETQTVTYVYDVARGSVIITQIASVGSEKYTLSTKTLVDNEEVGNTITIDPITTSFSNGKYYTTDGININDFVISETGKTIEKTLSERSSYMDQTDGNYPNLNSVAIKIEDPTSINVPNLPDYELAQEGFDVTVIEGTVTITIIYNIPIYALS